MPEGKVAVLAVLRLRRLLAFVQGLAALLLGLEFLSFVAVSATHGAVDAERELPLREIVLWPGLRADLVVGSRPTLEAATPPLFKLCYERRITSIAQQTATI